MKWLGHLFFVHVLCDIDVALQSKLMSSLESLEALQPLCPWFPGQQLRLGEKKWCLFICVRGFRKKKKDCVVNYVLVKVQNICIISLCFCKPREKRRANEREAKRHTQKTTIISLVKWGSTLINYW